MYRIAKLAELLNVTTVQIHEKLILHKADLAPYTHKENGVTVLTDPGLLILKHAFEEEQLLAMKEATQAEPLQREKEAEAAGALSEIDRRELELLNLKDRLNQNRSELHRLNMESRKLDEAILHYMAILKEDFDRRIRQEDQLEGALRFQRRGESAASQIGFFSGPGRK